MDRILLLAVHLWFLCAHADEVIVDADGRASRNECRRLAAMGHCEREPHAMAKACAESCAHLLLNAAYLGDSEMVRTLLQGGAAVSTQNAQGATPLHYAAHGNKAEIAKMLLENGASAGAKDARGTTALHYAAHGGHSEMVHALITGAQDTIDSRDHEGATALHLAAYRGHSEVVLKLIAGGSNVDAQDDVGVVALHRATYNGHATTVRALVEQGATVDVQNVQGVTPLHRAASRGDADVVRALLAGGAAVDMRDNEGKPALAFAAYHGHSGVVSVLLEQGAAVDAADGQGKVSLHWAAMAGRVTVARELLAHGANVDSTDRRGKTALHHAARQGQVGMVHALVEGGASFVRSEEGVTPVDSAIYHAADDASAVEVLSAMAIGGSTAARDAMAAAHPWTKQTPVHIASYLGRRATVKFLLGQGAIEDSIAHIQAGDGLRERGGSLAEAREAYAAAVQLESSNSAAAARLRSTPSAESSQGGEITESAAALTHTTTGATIARDLAGVSVHLNGSTSEDDSQHTNWADHAAELWREQGVVVFPALLNSSVVQSLREAAESVLRSEDAVDLSGLIRQSSGNESLRTLRPMSVSPCQASLTALASALAPFLERALMSPRQLLLDFGVYRTAANAEAQEWHTDSPFLDGRIAHVQVSLVATEADQGELQVQPATHGPRRAHAEAVDVASVSSEHIALAPLPAGTVSLYRLDLVHRGGRHALPQRESRMIGTLKLMAEHALMPDGIPLKMLPVDAGRWWLDGDTVVDSAPPKS